MSETTQKAFLYGHRGRTMYGIHKYVVDEPEAVSELPTEARVGSSCLVISNGDVYVINSKKEWVKQPSGGGGGGSAAEPIEALTTEEILAIIAEVEDAK